MFTQSDQSFFHENKQGDANLHHPVHDRVKMLEDHVQISLIQNGTKFVKGVIQILRHGGLRGEGVSRQCDTSLTKGEGGQSKTSSHAYRLPKI